MCASALLLLLLPFAYADSPAFLGHQLVQHELDVRVSTCTLLEGRANLRSSGTKGSRRLWRDKAASRPGLEKARLAGSMPADADPSPIATTCEELHASLGEATRCEEWYTSDDQRAVFSPCQPGQPPEPTWRCTTGEPLSSSSGQGCSISSWRDHLHALRDELARVTRALRRLARRMPRSRAALQEAEASLAVAEVFLGAAPALEGGIDADAALSLDVREAMMRQQLHSAVVPAGWAVGPHDMRQLAEQLPYDELAGTEVLLVRALRAAYDRLREWDGYAGGRLGPNADDGLEEGAVDAAPLASPPVSWMVERGYLRDGRTGTRLYLNGFNTQLRLLGRATEPGAHPSLDQAGARRLRALGVNVAPLVVNPAAMLLPDLALSHSGLAALSRGLQEFDAAGILVQLHIASNLPRWALDKYEGLELSDSQHGIRYDIDHPAAVRLTAGFLRSLARELGCDTSILGWELANEPALRGTLSSHATISFASWLQERYITLANLTAAWSLEQRATNFEAAARAAVTTFSNPQQPNATVMDLIRRALDEEGERSGKRAGGRRRLASRVFVYTEGARPMAMTMANGVRPIAGMAMAAWADWSAFNDFRVSRWQGLLASALWSEGSCHATMGKVNHANTVDPRLADNGIDTAAWVGLHNVTAYDSDWGWPGELGRPSSFKSWPYWYSTDGYSSDWLNQVCT
jgi:hypothetical protein